jgi:hypothetical protein
VDAKLITDLERAGRCLGAHGHVDYQEAIEKALAALREASAEGCTCKPPYGCKGTYVDPACPVHGHPASPPKEERQKYHLSCECGAFWWSEEAFPEKCPACGKVRFDRPAPAQDVEHALSRKVLFPNECECGDDQCECGDDLGSHAIYGNGKLYGPHECMAEGCGCKSYRVLVEGNGEYTGYDNWWDRTGRHEPSWDVSDKEFGRKAWGAGGSFALSALRQAREALNMYKYYKSGPHEALLAALSEIDKVLGGEK